MDLGAGPGASWRWHRCPWVYGPAWDWHCRCCSSAKPGSPGQVSLLSSGDLELITTKKQQLKAQRISNAWENALGSVGVSKNAPKKKLNGGFETGHGGNKMQCLRFYMRRLTAGSKHPQSQTLKYKPDNAG